MPDPTGRALSIVLLGDVTREHPAETDIYDAAHEVAERYGLEVLAMSGPYYDGGDERDLKVAALEADRDRLREILADAWLYVHWRHVTKQLTAEQKEMWASAVEASGDPDVELRADRWWRCPTCGPDTRAKPSTGPHEGCHYAETLTGGSGTDG